MPTCWVQGLNPSGVCLEEKLTGVGVGSGMGCFMLCKAGMWALLTVPSPGSLQMSYDNFLDATILTVHGGITLALRV